MTGARVGNWYLEAEIGRGALGIVYRARDYNHPDRRAAVKVFTGTPDVAFVQNFAAEMLPLQRLEHVNIAKYFDSGTHSGLAFVACELIEGTDLASRLSEGRLPWRDVLSVAVQAARALKHAHNRNVLHRDLKPAHLMLMPDGTLKILGFGLGKVVPAPPPSPVPAIGSAAYIPPETASGKPLTRRSDFYSLGGVLYTLVTGRPPFVAGSLVELMHKQCYTLPERPAMLVPELPAELDEFICVLLEKNPSRRPAAAAGLLDELERIRGKLERKGEKLAWPAKVTPDTAEMTPLPAALSGTGGDAEPEAAPRPLLKRPLVVVPLFLAALLALVLPFVWPTPGADDLYAAAKPLLDTNNPTDWDQAEKYLERLSRKYPDRYTEEVAAARARIKDQRELRRVVGEMARIEPSSHAEQAYLRGLRLAQAGDADAARKQWHALVTAFETVTTETRWVALANAGLAGLENRRTHAPNRAAFDAALTHAKTLTGQARTTAFQALETLVGDEPELLTKIRDAATGRQ